MFSRNFYLFGIFLTITIGSFAYYFFCCNTAQVTLSNDEIVVPDYSEKTTVEEISEKIIIEDTIIIEDSEVVKEIRDETNSLNELCDDIFSEPFIITFQSGKSDINLTSLQQERLENIGNCVLEFGISILITGHTDNTGSETTNLRVGKQRADALRALLLEKNVAENQVKTASKGESEPIASNSIEEGRTKNRRIVITKTN